MGPKMLGPETFVLPYDRLPRGFAEHVDSPPVPPAEPRPASTVLLLRDGEAGPEVLLLQRHRSSGFVPGAYVFPGGRVDDSDGEAELAGYVARPADADGPALEYWAAVVREVFEETGALLGAPAATQAGARTKGELEEQPGEAQSGARTAGDREKRLDGARSALLDGGSTLLDVVEALGLRLDLRDVVYYAHWITPVAEPRRYDTRFFLARWPGGRGVRPDPREVADVLWLRPAEALDRFHAGALPMIFPTVKTLEPLRAYDSVAEALAAFRGRPVRTVQPRLVRTERGIGIVVDE